MTGIEPSTDRIRIYSDLSPVANGEAIVMRSAFGKTLRIIDETGEQVGTAMFVAGTPPRPKPMPMPEDFDPEREAARMRQGGCCGKPSSTK